MTRAELLQQFETQLEARPGSLQGTESLADLPGWDSLTQVNFVVLAERLLGVRLPLGTFAECETVQDLLNIFENATK